jgi:hypothetical protein
MIITMYGAGITDAANSDDTPLTELIALREQALGVIESQGDIRSALKLLDAKIATLQASSAHG